ncbi:MAG: hypothetical protein ACXACO_11650 [Promethearchaeota archaeon]
MKIWEVLRNLEIMKRCTKDLEIVISEVKFHKEWDEEFPKPIKITNINSKIDKIIDIAKQLKEIF